MRDGIPEQDALVGGSRGVLTRCDWFCDGDAPLCLYRQSGSAGAVKKGSVVPLERVSENR
jgi:hypothetical protein